MSSPHPPLTSPSLEAILEGLSDPFFTLDEQWRLTFVNAAAEQFVALPREQLISRSVWEVLPSAMAAKLHAEVALVLAERRAVEHEVYDPVRQLWLEVRAHPIEGGVALQWRDVTERRRAEERSLCLQALSAGLTEAVGEEQVIRVFLEQGIAALGAKAGSVLLLQGDGNELLLADQVGCEEALVRAWQQLPLEQALPMSDAVRRREAIFLRGPQDPRYPQLPPLPEGHAMAVLPLLAHSRVLGAWVLSFREDRTHSLAERDFMNLLAEQLAHGLERTRLYAALQTELSERKQTEQALQQLNATLEARVEERTRELSRTGEELGASNRALEAFAVLSHELAVETDRPTLVRRAQEILLSLLPDGASTYYELEGDEWQLRSMVGDLRNPLLAESLQRGLRRGSSPNLDTPYDTRAPFYQSSYHSRPTDVQTQPLEHLGASATFPVKVNGEICGVLVVVLYDRYGWTRSDRILLETALRKLRLALERAAAVAVVAEQKKLLERRTFELQELNSELEAFSYSVSHDLRAPLRHIIGFIGLLRKQGVADERSARYLEIIASSAERMSQLIDDLLTFSRLSRQPLQRALVDLGTLVNEVRADLAPDTEGREVVWEVGKLPQVPGDPALLRQVLANLLSNALKYSRGRDVTRIEVKAERTPQEVVVSVRDNGAGFNPKYQDRLFGVFQRLHRSEEFEGTGIGLANVRRIISRHGGRVWAEGELDKGATFYFSLPR